MSVPVVDTTTSVVPTDQVPWADFGEGIELKVLRVGGQSGLYTIVTRFAPGVQLPKHRHFGEVHAYTLEGRWRYLEYPWVAEAGAYVYEPPGSVHTLKVPDDNVGPTTVFFTIDKGMVFLGEHDEPVWIEDAVSLASHYANALAARGLEYPAATLP